MYNVRTAIYISDTMCELIFYMQTLVSLRFDVRTMCEHFYHLGYDVRTLGYGVRTSGTVCELRAPKTASSIPSL